MPSRKSPRAQRYDYTSPGGYFITVCTKNRLHYFGEIENNNMVLNELGNLCQKEISDTEQRRNHIRIDEYIVMPNHIHILMIVGEKSYPDHVGTYGNTSYTKDTLPRVPTDRQRIPIETLGSIVRNIKARVSKYANEHDLAFARQSRYYDHIIRNENEYKRIKYYIKTNPENRANDSLA